MLVAVSKSDRPRNLETGPDPAADWWTFTIDPDPTANGAALVVYNANGGADVACLELSAAGWTRTNRTYRFSGALVPGSPVTAAVLKEGTVKIRARGDATVAFPYSLDEPSQGRVGVRLSSGGLEFCAVAGGTVVVDRGGAFTATNISAPLECPPPPPCG